MRTSRDRILTTHVGSLIRPAALQEIMRAKQAHKTYDHAAYEACLRDSVAEVVRRQVQVGVDAVSDGEYGKSISWNQYVVERMSGFELRPNPPGLGGRAGDLGLDRSRFRGIDGRGRAACGIVQEDAEIVLEAKEELGLSRHGSRFALGWIEVPGGSSVIRHVRAIVLSGNQSG